MGFIKTENKREQLKIENDKWKMGEKQLRKDNSKWKIKD